MVVGSTSIEEVYVPPEAVPTLLSASARGLEHEVRDALDAGADVNVRDPNGETPLHKAAAEGYHAIAQLLLDAGADVNSRSLNGDTPLHRAGAVPDGRAPMVGIMQLLKAGADVGVTNATGETPLHKAAAHGRADAALVLLRNGADVNATNRDGQTPLHIAVTQAPSTSDCVATAAILLTAGARINGKDRFGNTPLSYGETDRRHSYAGDAIPWSRLSDLLALAGRMQSTHADRVQERRTGFGATAGPPRHDRT